MATYFQNKFRNETIRLQNLDYRWDGSYFITICTKNREHFFGEIKSIGQNRYQNIGKNSVSSIIGSYKSAVTKHARRLGYTFEWQRLYYDHLIQNEHS